MVQCDSQKRSAVSLEEETRHEVKWNSGGGFRLLAYLSYSARGA